MPMENLIVPTTPEVYSVASNTPLASFILPEENSISLEERVTLLLMRDLVRLGWRLKTNSRNFFEFVPPTSYSKNVVRNTMAYARNAILEENAEWISNHIHLARKQIACGKAVLSSPIQPRIEVCTTQPHWSSPYSEYVGRRIKLLIRDDGVEGSPVIGIAALGSSIIHIPDRDKWIGWGTKTRTKRIVYMMDAYVLGALPPYNHITGGKLIAYILASNEIRKIYRNKYANQKTLIEAREASDLVMIVTSSLYGLHSSQYNRLSFDNKLLYQPIGQTAGYGTLHITSETFEAMKLLVEQKGLAISYKFGGGPNWRMRVIRTACNIMGWNEEVILRHSFQRGLYAVPLADNWKEFLLGKAETPQYIDMPMEKLIKHWKTRWLNMRLANENVREKILKFTPDQFKIETTKLTS
jgi:hypothetical protein